MRELMLFMLGFVAATHLALMLEAFGHRNKCPELWPINAGVVVAAIVTAAVARAMR